MKVVHFYSAIALAFVLTGCFSSWQGDDTALTLHFGGSSSRATSGVLYPPDDFPNIQPDLRHTIVFTSSTGSFKETVKGKNSVMVMISPGMWDIAITTTLDDYEYAEGSSQAEVVAGKPNAAAVTMKYTGNENGTRYFPWIITNETQLRDVGTKEGWTTQESYIVVNDIPIVNGDWEPIGTENDPFIGVFYGNEKKITDLAINGGGIADIGMFGVIGEKGLVDGLWLEGVNFSDNGANSVGGIAGQNKGTIRNSYVTGAITGSAVSNAGGVAGINDSNSLVEYCYSKVNVTIPDVQIGPTDPMKERSMGGIVGWNRGDVKSCYGHENTVFTGTYGATINALFGVGGIVGINDGGVENSYTTSLNVGYWALNITGSTESGAGGVVGINNSNGVVKNSYATGYVVIQTNPGTSADNYSAGGVAGINRGTVENCVAVDARVFENSVDPKTHYSRVAAHYKDENDGKLINNYGRHDMANVGMDTHEDWNNIGKDKPDGEDITEGEWENAGWWERTAKFPGDAWEPGPSGLPILKKMPEGYQNPYVRELGGSKN